MMYEAPCRKACPARVNIPEFIRLIRSQKIESAIATVYESCPLPGVTSYVCYRPCELFCNSNIIRSPIRIGDLKHFLYKYPFRLVKEAKWVLDKKVAVVGSGPAGLSAAFYLSLEGYRVTVFEENAELGGMMRYGIPPDRLPRDVLNREIEVIIDGMGIEVENNFKVDNLTNIFSRGFDAIFLAIGSNRTNQLGIKGQEYAEDFIGLLKDWNSGIVRDVGEKVVVIGGGNAGVDGARAAVWFGAKEVTIIYRRSWEEMPAKSSEMKKAISEGIDVRFLTAPIRLVKVGPRLRVDCVRTSIRDGRGSNRGMLEQIESSRMDFDADLVVSAIGQGVSVPQGFDVMTGENSSITVSKELSTSRVGVFAGGDCVTGPRTVVEAIAAGKKGALAIRRHFEGYNHGEEMPSFSIERVGSPSKQRDDKSRITLSEKETMDEARRCLGCDFPIKVDASKCFGCLRCEIACSMRYEDTVCPARAKIQVVPPDRSDSIGLSSIIFAEDCENCGLCLRACVYGALTRDGA